MMMLNHETFPTSGMVLGFKVLAITLGLPVTITAALAVMVGPQEMGAALSLVTASCLPLCIAGVFFVRRMKMTIDEEAVCLIAGPYRTTFKLSSIITSDIRRIEDKDDPARPCWRVNGIGFPGYGAGWFKLRNGRRAFVANRGGELVYVPRRGKYDLVIGIRDLTNFQKSICRQVELNAQGLEARWRHENN